MSSFFIKIFALLFMIIDHVGFVLFPNELIYRIIGRLSFPLFAYQMAVGFSHTRSKEKHILKLLFFAFICQWPYNLMLQLYNSDFTLNIIFTFVLSLLIIYFIEKFKFIDKDNNKFDTKNFLICVLSSTLLMFTGISINVDYTWYGILLTIAFYFSLNHKLLSSILFFLLLNLKYILDPSMMSLFAYISLFDILFIVLFNGKRGYKFSWIFYMLYFMHFFVLLALKQYLQI